MRHLQFPSIPQALLLLLLVVLGQLIVGLVMGVVMVVTGKDLNSLLPWFLGIGNLLVLGVAACVGWVLARRPAAQVFPLRSVAIPLLAITVLISYAGQVVLSELDNLTRLFFPPLAGIDQMMQSLTTGGSVWGSLLALVVVAPLTEELLFRGLVLQGLLTRYRPWAAAVWSAVLFAVFHLNPWQMLPALLLGLFFAWLTIRTRSLLPGILAHAAANSLPLIIASGGLAKLLPGLSNSNTATVSFQPLWLDVTAAALIVLGITALARLLPRTAEVGSEEANVAAGTAAAVEDVCIDS